MNVYAICATFLALAKPLTVVIRCETVSGGLAFAMTRAREESGDAHPELLGMTVVRVAELERISRS